MTSPKNTFKQRVFSLTTLLQVDAKEDEGTSFIFMSDEAMTKDKLMILIHGSGVVRAGQWARRYLIQRVNKIFFFRKHKSLFLWNIQCRFCKEWLMIIVFFCRLIINNDLNSGTMLPYIRRASQVWSLLSSRYKNILIHYFEAVTSCNGESSYYWVQANPRNKKKLNLNIILQIV